MEQQLAIPSQYGIIIKLFSAPGNESQDQEVTGPIRQLIIQELIAKEPLEFIKYNFGYDRKSKTIG